MRRRNVIYGFTCLFIVIVIFKGSNSNSIENTPVIAPLKNNFRVSTINPRDVFLLFTKTEKTSSTVAASLIMEAYTRNGIPIANDATGVEGQVAGTFASISHRNFSQQAVEVIEYKTQKPVILIVSIRDGHDWLQSYIARADSETKKLANGSYVEEENICKRFSPSHSKHSVNRALVIYSSYLPIEKVTDGGNSTLNEYKLTYTPWSVIRHENVVEDTCDLLKRLGLECNRDAAFGQASRAQVGLDNCNYTADTNVVDNVNKINDILWSSRAEHDGIKRE